MVRFPPGAPVCSRDYVEPSRYIKIDVKLSKRDKQSIEKLLEGKFKVLTDAKLFVKVENKK